MPPWPTLPIRNEAQVSYRAGTPCAATRGARDAERDQSRVTCHQNHSVYKRKMTPRTRIARAPYQSHAARCYAWRVGRMHKGTSGMRARAERPPCCLERSCSETEKCGHAGFSAIEPGCGDTALPKAPLLDLHTYTRTRPIHPGARAASKILYRYGHWTLPRFYHGPHSTVVPSRDSHMALTLVCYGTICVPIAPIPLPLLFPKPPLHTFFTHCM